MNPSKSELAMAEELMSEFRVMTAGEGEYGDDGIYANRYSPDVRKSDTESWLTGVIALALRKVRLEAGEGYVRAAEEHSVGSVDCDEMVAAIRAEQKRQEGHAQTLASES